ncbi:centrosomal protein of 89 kDa-like isoform X2 [Argiope bruennichi]|uniref:centrosomal protein of 89 kDa-like isoform X2 n=1 Tax=Argiope bruennichi TaxID=94029 RepID=UPI0024942570|nr:centrosomal protein of 89 kDa-like isoform X2 [Argiope bruennichi]
MEEETSKKSLKSPKSLAAVSFKKNKKYKNLWTSLWSPSNPKRHAKKDINESPQFSLTQENGSKDKQFQVVPSHQECNESIYSSITELGLQDKSEASLKSHSEESLISSKNETPLSHIHKVEINQHVPSVESTSTVVKEPIYAKVDKDKSKILIAKLTDENKQLKEKAEELVKEARRKEETLYAKLQLEITQLEAETRREVKSLSDRIQILLKEREALNEQIDLLQAEKKDILLKCNALSDGMKTMISPKFHRKIIAEYKKLLNESKQKHEEEIKEYQQKCEVIEEANKSLTVEVKGLKEEIDSYQTKIETLSSAHQKLFQEKNELSGQLEEAKQLEQENQKLLQSLLKITENLTMERDVLLNKVFYQDNQQKELQSTVIDYSVSVGRLQEHISKTGNAVGKCMECFL